MIWNQTTIIVTAAVAANLQKLSERLEKNHCKGMFTVGLSATGAAPPTHFISSGLVPDNYLNAVTSPTRLFTKAKAAYEADGDVFPFTQAQVTNALSKCTLSDGTYTDASGVTVPESPQELMARLGLMPVATAL